jgi:adenosylcobinamide-phosphate synthase
MAAPLALLALLIELMVGYPDRLTRAIGHPVTWMGRLIGALDRRLNRDTASPEARRQAGAVAILVLIAVVGGVAFLVEQSLLLVPFGFIAVGILCSTLLAQQSLFFHVAGVADALGEGGVAAGREAVAEIVGRDTADLDEPGIARAAIESLAENASDGIVAPVFWGALFGLPGILGYKAINTLDSMIGHRNERHEAFGWAAARIDDVANFIPARLTGFLFALLAPQRSEALSCMMRDARRHRSPNAGWPEAAMAGALGVRLSGPRIYHGSTTNEPWLNEAARDPLAADIDRGLTVYRRAMLLLAGILAILVFA